MDFAQQLHRAEQLAKAGSLVMPPGRALTGSLWLPKSVDEPDPVDPWGPLNGGLPSDWFKRNEGDRVEEERVVIEFTGTPDPDSDFGRWWKAEHEKRMDAVIIHHDDGTMSVPANHPRLRPHVCLTAPASSASPSS